MTTNEVAKPKQPFFYDGKANDIRSHFTVRDSDDKTIINIYYDACDPIFEKVSALRDLLRFLLKYHKIEEMYILTDVRHYSYFEQPWAESDFFSLRGRLKTDDEKYAECLDYFIHETLKLNA